jgi:hypothetical protein
MTVVFANRGVQKAIKLIENNNLRIQRFCTHGELIAKRKKTTQFAPRPVWVDRCRLWMSDGLTPEKDFSDDQYPGYREEKNGRQVDRQFWWRSRWSNRAIALCIQSG